MPVPVHAFDFGGVRGQAPVTWQMASFDTMAIAHSDVFAYLSTEAISNPCTRLAPSPCPQYPVTALAPDGVLITWTEFGLGGTSIDWASGDALTVGGRQFRVQSTPADTACVAIGGERTVIARSPHGQQEVTEMNACYRGPDTEMVRAQIQVMLDSITWQ